MCCRSSCAADRDIPNIWREKKNIVYIYTSLLFVILNSYPCAYPCPSLAAAPRPRRKTKPGRNNYKHPNKRVSRTCIRTYTHATSSARASCFSPGWRRGWWRTRSWRMWMLSRLLRWETCFVFCFVLLCFVLLSICFWLVFVLLFFGTRAGHRCACMYVCAFFIVMTEGSLLIVHMNIKRGSYST